MTRGPRSLEPFRRFAVGVLLYTVAVILFGAFVRITGSGAGCGQHWPTCQGEVAHLPATVETAIELTHRVTSGLSLVAVVALLVWSRRLPVPPDVRRWSAYAVVFMVVEALVGAALVLASLTGENSSAARAVVIAVHLVNTSLLLGALALVVSRLDAPVGVRPVNDGRRWLVVLSAVAVLLLSMTGAVTALGDTLFPPAEHGGVLATVAADQAGRAALVQRARFVHPVLAAVLVGFIGYALVSAVDFRRPGPVRRWGSLTLGLVVVQLVGGALNIALHAPAWLQLTHLATASALWIGHVLLWDALRVSASDPALAHGSAASVVGTDPAARRRVLEDIGTPS